MRRSGSGWVLSLCVIAGLLAPRPLPAVVILESTWREEGGGRGREAEGFGAHIRLAHEPQFRALVTLSFDGGKTWGDGSGTWIGNDASHGYVLTSAHNFDGAEPGETLFRTEGGTVLRGVRGWIHPGYSAEEDRTGVDVAVVRLDRPVTDAGEPPALYGGTAEKGQTITFVGFGMRGTGRSGEDDRYHEGTDKAAAQGVVDEVVALRRSFGKDGDPGNYLTIVLPREDGRVENGLGGSRRPVSRLAGLLGAGDSGGSAWMRVGGGWAIVGINAAGDGTAQYGDHSWFTRVSGVRSWVASIFPGTRFAENAGAEAPQAWVRPDKPAAVPEPQPASAAGCAERERLFVFSDGAWYPARARGPARQAGACRVRFDGYSAEEDEVAGPDRMMPWTPEGPGDPLRGCRPGAAVLAEEDGVWFPGVLARTKEKAGQGVRGCVVRYEDSDYDDEFIPLARLRAFR